MKKIFILAIFLILVGTCHAQSSKSEFKAELMPYTLLTGDTTLLFEAGAMKGIWRYTVKVMDNTDTVSAYLKTAIIIEDAVNDDLDYTFTPFSDTTRTVLENTSWSWDDPVAAFTKGKIFIHVSDSALVSVRYLIKYDIPFE